MSFSNIYWNGSVIGKAAVEREGLYYKIDCVCDLPEEGIFRICAITATEEINLGVCIPKDGKSCLVTRVPVRRLGDNLPQFHVVEKEKSVFALFELIPGQPFEQIRYLRECCFICNDGKKHLVRKITQ